MKIESITQGRHPQVVYVILDDGTRIRMQSSVVMDQGLYPGMEIDAEQLAQISAAAREASARARAVRIISASASTEEALERKLIQKGEEPGDARQAVRWLKELNLLDDGQVARQLVQCAVRKGYGKARIKQILFEKQVPKQYWDEALALIPDMGNAIDAFLQKRFHGAAPDRQEQEKAIQALLRRGHSWGDIRAALVRYDQTCQDQWEEEDIYGI